MARRAKAAGVSAQGKYVELTRLWRRRNRGLFLALTWGCVAIGLVTFVAAHLVSSPVAGWLLGVLAGSGMSFVIIARESPPGWIQNWQHGAWGEEATEKVLVPLEGEGWRVFHDLPDGRANVDHIVVGPGGVFLLDSKRPGGRFEVGRHGAVVTRFDDPLLTYQHSDTPRLLALARRTHDRVLAATRLNVWVTPVMVVWTEFPQRRVTEQCVYLHGDELASWLREQPQRIAPHRVDRVAEAVRMAWEQEV